MGPVLGHSRTGRCDFALWMATRQLVLEARENSERQLRAYVLVEQIVGHPGGSNSGMAVYTVQIKNSGQTPAFQLATQTTVETLPKHSELSNARTPDHKPSKTAIGSQGSAAATVRKALDSNEQAALDAGTHEIFVHGVITYQDAFGKERWTKFRHSWAPGDLIYSACPFGNDSN